MKILIDADGCPVVTEATSIAKEENIKCIVICDTSHIFNIEGVETITVSKDENSVDFKLVNMILDGDIVITQDYALAAMCLSKKATVINQNGLIYNDDNILSLLNQRHIAQKIRRSGGRLRGTPPRDASQTKNFITILKKVIYEKKEL